MRQLIFLDSARADIAQIYAYIEEKSGSSETAERFTRELNMQCRRLATLPVTLGRARPELRADIRSFVFKNYLIFFRYTNEAVEIVNIVEGHRDLLAFFADDLE